MLTAEARLGDWAAFTDVMYTNLFAQKSTVAQISGPAGLVAIPVNLGGSLNLNGTLATFALSRNLGRGPAGSVDFFAGFRYANFNGNLGWQFAAPVANLAAAGSVKRSVTLWDGIGGLRGRVNLGSRKLFIPFYVDGGAGGSMFTWQAFGGIGYRLGATDLVLGFRELNYLTPNSFMRDMTMRGPLLSATFRF